MKSKEDIDFKEVELDINYPDISADSQIRTLASKNSLVIAVVLSLSAIINLLFGIYKVYDIIPASFVLSCMVLLNIIVLYINDYLFNKKLKKVIAYRYLDRVIYDIIKSNMDKDTKKED